MPAVKTRPKMEAAAKYHACASKLKNGWLGCSTVSAIT
eukprot:CAMPEP_0171668572 /NCGR_PEP_ID=MMETSP0990-20121206/49454_1 /TAXON_ID=483369 /ORGANISM="non described non described, Strain CCMP2098" /LENGTH=37 /DNA_ID= /DNA_START= /DNA_END= /DNA_ORIENTATION=